MRNGISLIVRLDENKFSFGVMPTLGAMATILTQSFEFIAEIASYIRFSSTDLLLLRI